MSHKNPARAIVVQLPQTQPTDRFKNWAKSFGILPLSRVVGVRNGGVHAWLTEGKSKRRPSVDVAQKIIVLSHVEPLEIGPLSYDDIFGPVAPQRTEVGA